MISVNRLLAVLLVSACAMPAMAEKADRNKPIQLEADSITVDDANRVRILEGRVVLTKGTMQLKTEKLVVTEDGDGFQKAVATGGAKGLAYFKQRREGSDEYVEGEAERIEYDDKIQRTDLYNRAWLKSGKDEVRGQFIRYDERTEKYTVTNSDSPAAGGSGRVTAVIQPRGNAAETAPPPQRNTTTPSAPTNNKK
jgi:lipopolysaccharide export system protein LptA